MKKIELDKKHCKYLGLILFISLLQPYFVLIDNYGPSAECLNCLIIGQTWIDSILYLFIPLSIINITLRILKINIWIYSIICGFYFGFVSFHVLTIPLFKDRIAAWSTFTDAEIYSSAIFLSFPSLLTVSIIFSLLLVWFNKKT